MHLERRLLDYHYNAINERDIITIEYKYKDNIFCMITGCFVGFLDIMSFNHIYLIDANFESISNPYDIDISKKYDLEINLHDVQSIFIEDKMDDKAYESYHVEDYEDVDDILYDILRKEYNKYEKT